MGKKEPKARAHTWYIIDMEKGIFRFNRRLCPRCGSVMAYHKEPVPRWHCGKCGYTIFETQRPRAVQPRAGPR